ncbi:MAG: beta-N-acetylhexosaminidase [Anaerolineales bacterium]|jgi:hexosaminidase
MEPLIPQPTSITPGTGTFRLSPEAVIRVNPGSPQSIRIAKALARLLRPATGYDLPVQISGDPAPAGSLVLTIPNQDASLGEEGYELQIEPQLMTLRAYEPHGLFHGIQTIRQLFPPSIEAGNLQAGPWNIDTGLIHDLPHYAWRGVMLDVARHFFKPETVIRLIDLLAAYKFNILHLHLTDDQGWRLMINSWPNLAKIGGSTAIRGDPGGYFTQEEYQAIVEHARACFITVIPEIDLPGHTCAALASYPELNPGGKAPALYTGSEVGFSSLSISEPITQQFLGDVIREVAALTPGPYLHIGGDEAHSTTEQDYRQFIERLQELVLAHGKKPLGWEEIARVELVPEAVVQYWINSEWALKAGLHGNPVVMSPCTKAYMDIKYNEDTPFGQTWTGSYTEIQDAYEWDPSTFLSDLPPEAILGLEAPLWTEEIATPEYLDFMLFPRLCGYAEIGWTPAQKRDWGDYRRRLAGHGDRLTAMGVNYYRSPQISWND